MIYVQPNRWEGPFRKLEFDSISQGRTGSPIGIRSKRKKNCNRENNIYGTKKPTIAEQDTNECGTEENGSLNIFVNLKTTNAGRGWDPILLLLAMANTNGYGTEENGLFMFHVCWSPTNAGQEWNSPNIKL